MEIGIACAFRSAQGGSMRTAITTAASAAEELGFAAWWGWGDRDVASTTSHDATLGLYAVARSTRSLRLGLAGELLAVRPAAVRSKQLASLDWFSGGRVELALDLDAPPAVLVEQGAPTVADPLATTIDRLGAMETLWTQRRGRFTSATVSFAGAIANPKTIDDRRLPVHVRHGHPSGLRRLVESRGSIDGWTAWKLSPAELTPALDELRDALPAGHTRVRTSWFVEADLVPASREHAAAAGIDEVVAVFDRIPEADELREVIA